MTIPKEIRKKLNSDFVYFEVRCDGVTIKPLRDAAGSLREFVMNVKPGVTMKARRVRAWDWAIREKTGKKDKVR